MSNYGTSEYDHYGDKGCEESPTCLTCPLPICKYDDPAAHKRRNRIRKIDGPVMEALKSGLTIDEVAIKCSVDVRTVFRVLERARLSLRNVRAGA